MRVLIIWRKKKDIQMYVYIFFLQYISLTLISCFPSQRRQHPDCYPMKVPANDSHYGQFGVTCLEFVRSSPTPRIDCPLGPREQVNQVTSYLDGSQVYGSTKEQEDQLRLFKDGLPIIDTNTQRASCSSTPIFFYFFFAQACSGTPH